MDFASKFVLTNDEDEYESISEEEFHQGMHISDSGSGSENEETMTSIAAPLQVHRSGETRNKRFRKNLHHWKKRNFKEENQKELPLNADIKSDKATASKRRFRRADTNVLSVNFSKLQAPGNMHAGEPVFCSKCLSILSHLSCIDWERKEWKCEFCEETTIIDVESEEVPTTDDVTYLLEPALTTASSTMSGVDKSLVIFCVDTSGSMCVTSEISGTIKLRGTSHLKRLQSFVELDSADQRLPSQYGQQVTYISRLQAMQAAVDFQLGEMTKNHPNRRVALITFNNEVTIIGDGSQREVIVSGDKLTNEEELSKIGAETLLPQSITVSRKTLGEKVYNLEEGGSTALGPALIIAINLAAQHPGSKVILCTDGKANIGLGKLEDDSDEHAAFEFYTKTAESALAKGVTVSIITIEGTDCKLVQLGTLADKTGGQVNIVDPLKLTEEFGTILADPIIATRVKAKLILHKNLYVVDEEDNTQLSRSEYNAGNVKSSTTITFEFAKRKVTEHLSKLPEDKEDDIEKSEQTTEGFKSEASTNITVGNECSGKNQDFPFQLQIEYVDVEGNKALRVLTRNMPSTKNRQITEDCANLDILGAHVAKKSADLALKGQFSKSRALALMNQRLAWRSAHSETSSSHDRAKYKTIYSKLQHMENYVHRQQMSEISAFGHTRSDSDSSDEELSDRPLMLLAAKSPGKMKKMALDRCSEMGDSMANVLYRFRSVDANEISSSKYSPSSSKETKSKDDSKEKK